ncbi:HEAT repeat protein [Teladorsagia circumcincta]|uniref:HEAT repeat protein n=1 Tax=Teladorsagia circumcincta TaxID=45464 RepID=A0A2G9UDR1_TELCI|nr:HEAT repeat protein [Teladorsagia circumcincta]
MAAVLALSATQQFYSLIEIANRVLPALAPLTCDPEKQVRDQAFKAIKGFMENLEKASEHPELIPEIESQVKAGGRSLLNSDKVPQWASWALKSLSGKFYKGTPPPEARPTTSPETSENAGTAERPAELIPEIESQVKAGGRSLLSSDKVPQWASWALKSLSGKFYKGTPPPEARPATSPETSENAGTAERPAVNDFIVIASTETKKPDEPLPDVDGWGDLDDTADIGSIDEWADALEPPVPLKIDDDDWSGGWDALVGNKIFTFFDVVPPLWLFTAKTTTPGTTGWSDFSSGNHSKVDDWGADLTALAKPLAMASLGANKDKTARRSEAAARTENRRKDMTDKKTKRTTTKPATNTSTTLEGFEDW